MQFDLTGAVRQIQEMGNAFLEKLPYVAAEALRELPRALGHGGAPGAKGS